MLLWIIYVMELLRFLLFTGGIFGTKIRRYWLAAGSCVIYALVLMLWNVQIQRLPLKFSIVVPSMIVTCFMQKEKWLKRVAQVVLADVILNSIAELVILFVEKIIELVFQVDTNDWWWRLMSYAITTIIILVVLMFVIFFRSKHKKWKIRYISATWLCILFAFVMTILSLVSSSVKFMARQVNDKSYCILSDVIAGTALAGLMVLVFIFVYIYFMDERLKKLYNSEKILKESQKIYYETLLEKEDDTRRFRHDMVNHMLYMQQLANEHKNEDLVEYIANINHKLTKIQKQAYITGDEILDTMLNYYVKQLKYPVDIRVFGRIHAKINANSMVLCTIFSNLVKNAVEELNAQYVKDAIFYLHIFTGKCQVKIQFENTSREKNVVDGHIETTKQDTKNHGIGLQNVKEAVKCSQGIYELGYEKGIFRTTIYLPIIQDD